MSRAHENLSRAREKFRELQEEYPLLQEWKLQTDKAKRRYGVCKYKEKTISLSIHYLNKASYEQVENTLTHEVAHALVGHKHGHNRLWRSMHIRLGGDGERCGMMEIHPAKYIIRCHNGCVVARNPRTGEEFTELTRHRLTKRLRTASCAHCHEQLKVFIRD